jgi:integrase/recombinase XerD
MKEGKMKQAATLTEAQVKRVLRYTATRKHSTRDATIILFSLNAGLRAKELAALRVGDVYGEDHSVRTQFTLRKEQTKGARTRTVFVNRTLAQQLAAYQRCVRSTDAAAPLFQSQRGSAFSANTMCQLFLNIYHACGLTNASSHSGRRTFITALANKGVGVRVLAALAGHSSISTTQRYIDVNDTQLASAVELL